MDVEVPNSMAASSGASNDQEINQLPPPKQLDAGALFVLQSQEVGSWLHCSYHLTTSNVAPQLLSLPFALALLGWTGGITCIALSALVTFYSYNLLSLVLEHPAHLGRRHLRFRDMAEDILGDYWHINLVSILLCFAYSICATAASIHIGKTFLSHTQLDYSVNGSPVDQLFGTFNCISIIVNVYARNVFVNLQATIAPPVKGKMFKGLCLSFAVVVTTYFSVAISGYWAFGNESQGTVLSNFMGSNGHILLPKWLLVMINAFAFSQVFAVTLVSRYYIQQVYLQPTNEVLENWFADPKANQFATRNVIPRLFFRTLTVVSATFLAALLPFFGDIMALFGAFACIPLNLILPMIFYNITFKLSRKSVLLWMHRAIVVVSSVLVAIGAIASVRQIVLDAKTYSLFANV
ncbi:GABA transporter 1 [Linum perenne]